MTVKISSADKKKIRRLASYGLRDHDISAIFDFSEATLKRYCAEELKKGRAEAKSKVMLTAYEMATSGKSPTMTIFWLKTRCGWTEFDERNIQDKDADESKRTNYENTRDRFLEKLRKITNQNNSSITNKENDNSAL